MRGRRSAFLGSLRSGRRPGLGADLQRASLAPPNVRRRNNSTAADTQNGAVVRSNSEDSPQDPQPTQNDVVNVSEAEKAAVLIDLEAEVTATPEPEVQTEQTESTVVPEPEDIVQQPEESAAPLEPLVEEPGCVLRLGSSSAVAAESVRVLLALCTLPHSEEAAEDDGLALHPDADTKLEGPLAVATWLGRNYDLCGDGDWAEGRAEMLGTEWSDLLAELDEALHSLDSSTWAELKAGKVTAFLDFCVGLAQDESGPLWLTSDKLSWADAVSLELLSELAALDALLLESYMDLQLRVERFTQLPSIQHYYASRRLPFPTLFF